MVTQMHDVRMVSDETLTIEGEEYELEEGDIVALKWITARKYVNQFGIAEYYHGDRNGKYPVLDEEFEELVGPKAVEEKPEQDDEEEPDGEPDEKPDIDELVAPDEWLEQRTVKEVEEDVQEFDEPEKFLGALSEFAERKGAQKAIDSRIEELEEDGEEEQEDGEDNSEEDSSEENSSE